MNLPTLDEQEATLNFMDCRTKAHYQTWIEEQVEAMGFRLIGPIKALKLHQIRELAETLRYGEWKRDFIPQLSYYGVCIIRLQEEG